MAKRTPGVLRSALIALVAFAVGPMVSAAEHKLEFKLVVKALDAKVQEAPNIEGQVVFLNKMYGVAFFKDGRTASKDFIFTGDYNKGDGPFIGYSTYQFEDGSTIVARFAGTQRAGQPVHGEYTVISGTGTYAGAKGSGSFDGAPHKFTGGANLLNGKFSISTP